MSRVFNAEEILEVAVQLEQTGAAYYRQAAKFANDDDARRFLEELAEMEDGHELLFEKMRGDPDVLATLLGDPDGEIALYLRAFSEGHVFPKEGTEPKIGPDTDLDDVLSHAITMELRSIAFYQGIKDAVPEELGQEKVNSIIAEERRHVTMLSRQLAALRAE